MKDNLTFEQANAELEALVSKMESGELNLEDSMKCYEEAFELLSFCYKQLDSCKGQIVDINKRIDEIKNREEL
ncbi:MAG: exodeoxyribonuclease VII small subunit [Ruminococcus sp.]|jgi:exodeoxyribonuclease VII small subunit|nr:exodeoxyribonuclease VII small subunit [Ruminococcus sp.]